MADRFFMRFNLQNSVAHYAPTAELFAALLRCPKEETEAELANFERIRAERDQLLREHFGDRLSCLRGKKVLFLGDSLSSDALGFRQSVTQAADMTGVDGAISGATTCAILYPTKRKLQDEKPDLVSLMIGSNDSVLLLDEGEGQVSVEEYRRNVRMMLQWIADSGAELLLFEIPPVRPDCVVRHAAPKGKGQTQENIERYNAVLREAARELGFSTIAHRWIVTEAAREAYIEADGTHFTPEGQTAFSKYWLNEAILHFQSNKNKK